VLTGENLTDAQPGFDGQTQEPTVNLTLDAKGSRIFKDNTRDNVGKRMAIVLFENPWLEPEFSNLQFLLFRSHPRCVRVIPARFPKNTWARRSICLAGYIVAATTGV
jgi:preprotein translocase subunit SecD